MDDPLRPKTVPLSAETILWFEFLLDPSLLAVHLAKENAIPSPIELISKFLSITQETQANPNDLIPPTPEIESSMNKNEGLKIGRKQLALKILGLKVASHVKWNLQTLEKNLPLYKQVQLLSDLCSVTSGKTVSLPLSMVHECQLGPEGSKSAFNFALTLYHRWVLRTQLLKDLPQKPIKQGFSHLLVSQDQANSFRDEMIISSLEPFTQMSVDFLNQIIQDQEEFIHLVYDSFIPLSANPPVDNSNQNFSNAIKIPKPELRAQIAYDLCQFYLHDKKYSLARENILECRRNLDLLKSDKMSTGSSNQYEFTFCMITEDELNGCLMACGVFDEAQLSLIHQMTVSTFNQYKNIVEIFRMDNIKNEIPLVNRKVVELDMDGAHTLGHLKIPKETIIEVAALNVIYSLTNEEDLFAYSQLDYLQKYQKHNGFTILVDTTAQFLNTIKCSTKQENLKNFFKQALYTIADEPKASDLEKLVGCHLFTSDEIDQIKEVKKTRFSATENMDLPQICTMTDWKMSDSKIPHLEIGAIKRQLINCTSATTVRKLLVRLAAILSKLEQNLEPWNINPNWIMPMHIKTVLMSLQRGFFQDFVYILVAKSRDMAWKNEFKPAITMLNAVKSEIQRHENIPHKLSKLIDYEILLFQISQNLEEWPKRSIENQIMINKCKQCLSSGQSSDNIVPRVEILDACAAMAINLNETAGLISSEKRFPSSDLYCAVASAIADLELYKTSTTKKVCREAWDLVLAMFSTNAGGTSGGPATGTQGGKRNAGPSTSGGNTGNISNARDSPTIIVSTSLSPFLKKLRDPLPVTIMLSLLARLHNVLDDDPNVELNVDYMFLWPTSVSNASGYSKKAVSETLSNFLKQSLCYYPNHVSWIRLKGDLEFKNENYEAAMASYITAILTGSEYCTNNLQRQIDDYIVRRMIKCATNLGCYMQAFILCQFLEEIDYSLAFKTISERSTFKNLSEKSTYFSDAIDSYYNCIWDPTLLEYIINLQSKKGEHKRKQQAIAVIGQLELNANNNEEIKREAANSRRIKFLRALAKQYMIN